MKKFFTTLILFFSFLFNVKAIGISDCIITNNGTKKAGDTLELNVLIKFSDLNPNSVYSDGVAIVAYELNYDANILNFISADAKPVFNTLIQHENGKTIIASHVYDELTVNNTCYDNVLFCGNYYATLKFKVGNPTSTNTKITIKNIEIGYARVGTIETEDDILELNSNISSSSTVNFSIDSKGASVDKPITYNTKQSSKEVNNYLKKLEVENFQLNFKREKNDYGIYLKNNENTLIVNAEAEDSKSSVNIIGNDDLEKNNDKVTIEVTSEDGNKRIYTINIYRKNNSNLVYKNKDKTKKNNIINKSIIYKSLTGIIFLIITICVIIKIKDKRLDNELKHIDDF